MFYSIYTFTQLNCTPPPIIQFLLYITEPTEYVDYLFELKSKFGTPNLTRFEDLSNKEMMWVITEIVLEPNIRNRAKIIKEFIKVWKLFE